MSELTILPRKDRIGDDGGNFIQVERGVLHPGFVCISILDDENEDDAEAMSVILTAKQAKAVAKQIYAITNPRGMII